MIIRTLLSWFPTHQRLVPINSQLLAGIRSVRAPFTCLWTSFTWIVGKLCIWCPGMTECFCSLSPYMSIIRGLTALAAGPLISLFVHCLALDLPLSVFYSDGSFYNLPGEVSWEGMTWETHVHLSGTAQWKLHGVGPFLPSSINV